MRALVPRPSCIEPSNREYRSARRDTRRHRQAVACLDSASDGRRPIDPGGSQDTRDHSPCFGHVRDRRHPTAPVCRHRGPDAHSGPDGRGAGTRAPARRAGDQRQGDPDVPARCGWLRRRGAAGHPRPVQDGLAVHRRRHDDPLGLCSDDGARLRGQGSAAGAGQWSRRYGRRGPERSRRGASPRQG